jgi:rhomboid protease GluP
MLGANSPEEHSARPPDVAAEPASSTPAAEHPMVPEADAGTDLRRFPVTAAIILACLAGFGAQTLDPAGPAVALLMPSGPDVWSGQVWRLLTSVFLHVNLIHLAFNLYWAWIFGRALEPWLGSAKLAGVSLVLAVGSSGYEFLVNSATGGGIGFSGVCYGWFALLWAARHHRPDAARVVTGQVTQLFVAWFFLCIVMTVAGVMPVANAAHGSGAILGWLIGRALLAERGRRLWWLGVACAALGGLILIPFMTWDPNWLAYQGYRKHVAGDYAAAADLYRRSLERAPDNGHVWYNLALIQNQQGQTTAAIDSLRKAQVGEFKDPAARPLLVYLLWATADRDGARAALRGLHPGDFDGLRPLPEEFRSFVQGQLQPPRAEHPAP